MVQEHERAAGGWQAEWPIVSSVVQSTGLAISCMAEVAEGLAVNKERMRANIEATRGIIFAERASLLLGKKIGRDHAHKLMEQASSRSAASGRRLSEVLAEMPEVTQHLAAADLRDLETPEYYLGAAEDFRKALLASSRQANGSKRRRKKSAVKKKR
jgi:3-carboxy-cis,cis-muconate cycloisomerase